MRFLKNTFPFLISKQFFMLLVTVVSLSGYKLPQLKNPTKPLTKLYRPRVYNWNFTVFHVTSPVICLPTQIYWMFGKKTKKNQNFTSIFVNSTNSFIIRNYVLGIQISMRPRRKGKYITRILHAVQINAVSSVQDRNTYASLLHALSPCMQTSLVLLQLIFPSL